MRKLLIGCMVAATVALSPRTEARPPAKVPTPLLKPAPPLLSEVGVASWYGEAFQGKVTANGEVYDMNGLTAAHRDLPLGMKVKVTNLRNGQSVTVRINDRGPWIHGRLIDVSKATAQKLKFLGAGLTQVRIEVLSHPTPQGADASSAPSQEGL